MSQKDFVSGVISLLLNGSKLEGRDKLMTFKPFPDNHGNFSVGGNVNKAPLTYLAKHPLILESRSKITTRLRVDKTHHDCCNQGVNHLKANQLHNFLMIGLRKLLGSLGEYGLICRRWRVDNVRTKMADLTGFRFPDANKQYPLVKNGMYMLGPFRMEDKRPGLQMHYICLFTSLVTTAVHLKVCHGLSTDCPLMAIQVFVSRGG
ncbi:uncharacterized protein LOC142340397 [Convolutriloba macropyga]|uniref:uncharacterized protein LOC142340397 n=1 Tax=Convolutriloba macropyga TaxID=536237 RepID=UPI003F52097C